MNERNPRNRLIARSIFSSGLLFFVIAIIFVVPLFPRNMHLMINHYLFTLIIMAAALSIDRNRRFIFGFAITSIVVTWLVYLLKLTVLLTISRIVIFLFFIMIVIGLIIQIAKTERVTARVIIDSISGYLLLGLVFSIIIMIVAVACPEAFTFPEMDPEYGGAGYYLSDYMYYSFVTFTTLGYGDIVPTVPYAKSLAILVAVCGQIYLTVIIAMLVGKFLSQYRKTS